MEAVKREHITTYGEAAELLGTDIRTISGLVKALGLKPKKVRINNLAKGLDRSDIAAIRRALTPATKAATA
jgi:hypothetical protein